MPLMFKIESPETSEDLLSLIAACQDQNFRFGAGYTDLLVELKKQPTADLTVINLARLTDPQFKGLNESGQGLRIGALTTAHQIATDQTIARNFPVLSSAASKLASRQIRQVATIGGNVCTASPAGDLACALVALEATCEIMAANGVLRTRPIFDFFTGVRSTDLKKNEILRSFFIPLPDPDQQLKSDFIKIGTRRSMECSVISLAYQIQIKDDKITAAGVAIGSAAPTIKFAKTACNFLHGLKCSSLGVIQGEEFAKLVLTCTSPISDLRASAWYRSEVLFNISCGLLSNLNN